MEVAFNTLSSSSLGLRPINAVGSCHKFIIMKKEIIVCLSSKGRLKPESLNIFKKKRLKIVSEKGERDLVGYVKNKNFNLKILFVHAREAIDALANSTADVAISGKDLLFNSNINIQKKIKIYKNLDFGFASLKIFKSRFIGLIVSHY